MFENIILVLLLIFDAMCWWEARRTSDFQKNYLDQRKAWYEQRNRAKNKELSQMQVSDNSTNVARNEKAGESGEIQTEKIL